jgi:hypothetical protein
MEVDGQICYQSPYRSAKETLRPIGQRAGRAPDPVTTLWKRESHFFSTGNRTVISRSSTQLSSHYIDWDIATSIGCQVESYVTINGQSASLSWNKEPIWGLRPDLYYCQTVSGLLMWSALSERRRVCRLQLLLVSPAQSFSCPSPVGLATIFYYLRF